MIKSFSQVKLDFDKKYSTTIEFDIFLPEHLTVTKKTTLKKKDGSNNEQYYKWQFFYSLVYSGMYSKDYIGTEVHFPKGNKNSAPIKFDGAIFDDIDWFEHYKAYHTNKNQEALDWLRKHIIAVIEIKKENSKDVETVWNQQLKPALKESENDFCLGVLYDTERLYLFKKQGGKFLRLNEGYNTKKEESQTKDLQLHLTDSYHTLPTHEQLKQKVLKPKIDRSNRTVDDLEIISGVSSAQLTDGISSILRTMDRVSLINQRGYEILIQMIALKIFDEKKNEWKLKYYDTDEEYEDIRKLQFYIEPNERDYRTLNDKNVLSFTERIAELREQAETTYKEILSQSIMDLREEAQVRVISSVVNSLQDFSFTKSSKSDLWQIVFYQFANAFTKTQKAQFLTPIPLIEFIVDIVNPKDGETVIDPTSGSGDFLSVSYVKSDSEMNDKNIYGVDNDNQMVRLAQLNMLLNGDGRSTLKFQSGTGSISHKFNTDNELYSLLPEIHKSGNWEKTNDYTKLKKFDIVLTNPPFGEDRAFEPKDAKEKELIECYELWNLYGGRKIDLGIVFLENAYRILKENGRMGIVLSNSIASIDTHKKTRKWLMEKMRIVAIFDLPANVFGETGVNTTVIVAYKPNEKDLAKLRKSNYEIFSKNIQKVGYEVKTSKRVKFFSPIYKMDYNTFNIEIDGEGIALIDEEFTETVLSFKQWCLGQEKQLQDMFIKCS